MSGPHSLLGALYAFYLEHQRCGELDGGVDRGARVDDLHRVWRGGESVACSDPD